MAVSAAQSKDDFLPAAARAVAPYFILLLIVFAAYGNIFGNTFLFDDDLLIKNNEYLRDWSHVGGILTSPSQSGAHIAGGLYRPLQILLYLLLLQLGGGATFLFHLLNLSLHAANTCFVHRLGTKLGFKPGGVFLAALVWGVHPLHTSAVTYMSATADPLFVFFCLWTIIILLPDVSRLKILQILPLFLLGLLSKETMVIFPLLVMACQFLTNSQRLNILTYHRTWPLWAISLIYIVWHLHDRSFYSPQQLADAASLPNYDGLKAYLDHPPYRIYTFLATLPSYLSLLIWPQNLHVDYSFPVYATVWLKPVMMGLGITILATAQIVRSSKKPNYGIELSWGLLWFAIALAPCSGILIPADALFSESWMYLPSVGLFLGLAGTLEKALQNCPRSSFACVAIALVFAGLVFFKTYDQNKIWNDPVSFYGNIIQHNPLSARSHTNLGTYYYEIGDQAEAIKELNLAIQISDAYAETHYNLAYIYSQSSNEQNYINDIIANLQRSLEIDPNFYRSDKLLGDIYDNLGDKDKAKYYHDRADAILAQHQ